MKTGHIGMLEFERLAAEADHLPWVSTSTGRYRVSEYGLLTPGGLKSYGLGGLGKFEDKAPNEEEIALCVAWLRAFTTRRKTENRDRGSYGLKHRVEAASDHYIANGAFILAAAREGANIYANRGPNPCFGLNYDKRAMKHQRSDGKLLSLEESA